MTVYLFDSWHDAFAVCREMNRPIIVSVGSERLERIYPSGAGKPLNRKKIDVGLDIIKDMRSKEGECS